MLDDERLNDLFVQMVLEGYASDEEVRAFVGGLDEEMPLKSGVFSSDVQNEQLRDAKTISWIAEKFDVAEKEIAQHLHSRPHNR